MKKDKPAWDKDLDLITARQRVLNYLNNNTKCCWQAAPSPTCSLHTPEWIEREARAKVEHVQVMHEWTGRLGDLSTTLSAPKVGEQLAMAGLRDFDGKHWRATEKAFEGGYAYIQEHHGYPQLLWHRERCAEILN